MPRSNKVQLAVVATKSCRYLSGAGMKQVWFRRRTEERSKRKEVKGPVIDRFFLGRRKKGERESRANMPIWIPFRTSRPEYSEGQNLAGHNGPADDNGGADDD
jgi:hypothetical protein